MAALMGTFQLGDRRVWCTMVGDRRDRPPVIVVPGGPGAAHLYLRALGALSELRPIVFFDSLGSGQSERADRDWTIDDLLQELQQLVRVIGAPRYHVLGHSAAGFAVFPFAFAAPPELASVVLASCYPSVPRYHTSIEATLSHLSPEDRAWFVAAERDVALRDQRYITIAVEHIKHFFHTSPPPEFLRGLEGSTNVRAHRQIKGGSVFYTTHMAQWDVTERLREISVPTLISCGRYDFVTPELCAEMQGRIPRAEVAVFEHSGHMAHVEEPEAYLARLEAFFAANDAI
jgi:proline iminopeptidase